MASRSEGAKLEEHPERRRPPERRPVYQTSAAPAEHAVHVLTKGCFRNKNRADSPMRNSLLPLHDADFVTFVCLSFCCSGVQRVVKRHHRRVWVIYRTAQQAREGKRHKRPFDIIVVI